MDNSEGKEEITKEDQGFKGISAEIRL